MFAGTALSVRPLVYVGLSLFIIGGPYVYMVVCVAYAYNLAEGHVRKYCNTNIHCEFCKSYTHQTSVCRSYANFVRAHPMASSRRTLPAQIGRQQGWPQEPSEEAISSDTRVQNNEDQREGERKRELSEITRKHLERVINTMIPSSMCSSMDPTESTPVNSLVSQPAERSMEGTELKHVSTEREKQVIVNNYYISDGKEGWKHLEKSEIPLNKLENKAQGNFRVITPNRSENEIHGNSSEISPEKSQISDFNAQSGSEKEARYMDKDQKVTTQAKTEPRRFYEQGAEIQNMSPPANLQPQLSATK